MNGDWWTTPLMILSALTVLLLPLIVSVVQP